MLCCTNSAILCILPRVALFEELKIATSCLICGVESSLPSARFQYHLPMSFQLASSFFWEVPPGGKKETTNCPAMPEGGGMLASSLTPFMSLTVHSHRFPPASTGLSSAWFDPKSVV